MIIDITPELANCQKYHRMHLDQTYLSWSACDHISGWLCSLDSKKALDEMRQYFIDRQNRFAEAAAAREAAREKVTTA
jgi:hypothetical protein